MSITYKTVAGDTPETISRKVYGSEEYAPLISKGNPGIGPDIPVGVDIVAPGQPDAPTDSPQQAPADNINEVAILVNGRRFRFWDSVQVTRSVDTIDTVDFGAPFEAELKEFRDAFRPFTFPDMTVSVGGAPLFTGTLLTAPPILAASKRILVSGYSTPGVLNDCTAPASAFPLESDGQNIRDIARTLCSPFGIPVVLDGDPGPVFERVALSPGKNVLPFLSDLARQRGFVIGSTTAGALIIQKSITAGVPVAKFRQGESPLISVVPFFDSQNYFSHITGIEPAFVGVAGSQYTTKNSLLSGVIRPHTYVASDAADADIKTSVDAKIGRMFGNMASYSTSVDTWRDSGGNLWAPNTIVSVLAPDAMIYSVYDFLIRSVRFERSPDREMAKIELVIPGAFSGQIPESLPWDE